MNGLLPVSDYNRSSVDAHTVQRSLNVAFCLCVESRSCLKQIKLAIRKTKQNKTGTKNCVSVQVVGVPSQAVPHPKEQEAGSSAEFLLLPHAVSLHHLA